DELGDEADESEDDELTHVLAFRRDTEKDHTIQCVEQNSKRSDLLTNSVALCRKMTTDSEFALMEAVLGRPGGFGYPDRMNAIDTDRIDTSGKTVEQSMR